MGISQNSLDKDDYIKSLEISIELLQREIESLRGQLTESHENSRNQDQINPENSFKLLSGIKSKKDFSLTIDKILSENLNILENAIFEFDHTDQLKPIYYQENLKTFYEYAGRLQEDGVIEWAKNLKEIKIIQNLEESSDKTEVNNIIYYISIKGYSDLLFIAKTTSKQSEISNDQLVFLKDMLDSSLLVFDNIVSKEAIKSINDNINLQKSSTANSNIYDIATNVIESLYQSLGIIDANVKMIESGIGDSKRRIDIINDNSNKIRETGKKFLKLLENKKEKKRDSLKSIVNDVIFLTRSQLLRDAINVRNNIEEDIEILIDSQLLEKTILNILLIIRDNLKEGGDITISHSLKNGKNIIKIADNGTGYPIENVSNFNDDILVEGEFKNTFYKLAQIKNSIKELNGKLELVSRERAGSTFNIYLNK